MNEYTFWIIICSIICVTLVMLATIISASSNENDEETEKKEKEKRLENERRLKDIEFNINYMKDVIPVLINNSSKNILDVISRINDTSKKENKND